MRIDHKDSYKDFRNQFVVDSKLGGYWGWNQNFKDIVGPFDLKKIKNKTCMDIGCGSRRILSSLIKLKPRKNFFC